jgi:hypothetical protein
MKHASDMARLDAFRWYDMDQFLNYLEDLIEIISIPDYKLRIQDGIIFVNIGIETDIMELNPKMPVNYLQDCKPSITYYNKQVTSEDIANEKYLKQMYQLVKKMFQQVQCFIDSIFCTS